jgi:hypothetical protein
MLAIHDLVKWKQYLPLSLVLCLSGQRIDWHDPRVIKVESAVPVDLVIDERAYDVGEYIELGLGQHFLSVKGPYSTRLTVPFEIQEHGVVLVLGESRLYQHTCSGYADDPINDIVVARWEITAVTDPMLEGASLLILQGPEMRARTERLDRCHEALGCCGWDEVRHWNVTLNASPVRGRITVGDEFIAMTQETVSVPYGVSRRGGQEQFQRVELRVSQRNYIGCRWSLQELRNAGTTSLLCQLRRPQPR